MEDTTNNVHHLERSAVGAAVDEATKANEQRSKPVQLPSVQFELSLEGRANLLSNLAGQAMQGMLSSREHMFGTFGPMAATEAVRIAKAMMYAIEREVGELFQASQGAPRG